MKLKSIKIRNFRCCETLEIDVSSMHALVGANNAGKSTVLHALDLLFNPSTKKLSEESFFRRDMAKRIEVEGIFDGLTESERQELSSYIKSDGTFHIMRTVEAVLQNGGAEDPEGETKLSIQAHYVKILPNVAWLDPTKISSKSTTDWWREKDALTIHGHSFADFVGGTKPTVQAWKEKASEFASCHLNSGDWRETWIANPQGYAGVLKATLPHYELIPAVRDAADESRVTKTNPFGRLIYEVIASLDAGLRDEIDTALKSAVSKLNRNVDNERAAHVSQVEDTIKGYLAEVMPVDLELSFQAPTVEHLLTTPKILIDDGFSGGVEGKGHGLQRAVIFAILRSYAKLVTQQPERERRSLILGVEEPELYMHPTAQRTIRRVLRKIAESGDQVMITTHSPLMVDVEFFDEIIRVEQTEEGSPKPFQLPVDSLIRDLEARYPNLTGRVTERSVREKYRHAYTTSRNEGFFAKTVVLVEGATEMYALPIYASKMGIDFDARAISVVECGGKGQIDRMYRVFNELGIPCYVIFDYDLGNNDQGVRRDTRELLSLLGAADFEEPEAAVVGARFSCFRHDWETDLASQIDNYERRKSEAKVALGISGNGKGKPLVARYIALEIAQNCEAGVPELLGNIINQIATVSRSSSCLAGASGTGIGRAPKDSEEAVTA